MSEDNIDMEEIDELDDPVKSEFVRNRITQLVIDRNISENKASMEMGLGRSYINAITAGRALPSMKAFFRICNYFGVSEQEFFDQTKPSEKMCRTISCLMELDSEDFDHLLALLEKYVSLKKNTPNE